jgi:hypothetical protein
MHCQLSHACCRIHDIQKITKSERASDRSTAGLGRILLAGAARLQMYKVDLNSDSSVRRHYIGAVERQIGVVQYKNFVLGHAR